MSRDRSACLLDLGLGARGHRDALHHELPPRDLTGAEQLDRMVGTAHEAGAEQRLRRHLDAVGEQDEVAHVHGMRRMSGIWPPSKPGRTLPPWRAVWPLPPRPAVLPIPEPGPRPLRMRARCEPTGGFRSWSASRWTWDSGLGARDLARDLGLA